MLSRLVELREELPGIWSVLIEKPAGFNFTAGDYTELELDYTGGGGRRWFSLASAPSEKYLQITFKLPEPHSRFKAELMKLKPRSQVQIAPPMGNFNLPLSPAKVLFVAIGIGATPFRSITAELAAKKQLGRWDVKMVHAAKSQEFLFDNLFEKLGNNRIRTGTKPRLKADYLLELIPDLNERTVYLAGPQIVTEKLHTELSATMPLSRLRLSYFPGYKGRDA